MKTNRILSLATVLLLATGWVAAQAQDQLEVPGDNFSLEGALELFKKSSSPEEFEKLLNNPDSKVNNLDLNGDGYIDYIRVFDRNEGNIHTFAMQAVVSENQTQDVAVISLEKLSDGKAILQITGDEDIYGVETIIEPTSEVRTYAGTTSSRVVVNVWPWPIVRYVYGPYYNPWMSPWGWAYNPYWWSPWRPVAYYSYWNYWRPYRPYYAVCYAPRIYYGSIYRPYRTTSVIVYNRHYKQVNHYRSAYVERGGRDRYDGHRNGDRPGGRIERPSGRYDSNGRLTASSNIRSIDRRPESLSRSTEPTNLRSSAINRTDASPSGRSSRENLSSTLPQRRSTATSTDAWTGGSNKNVVTPERQRTPVQTDRSGSTNRQQTDRSVSTRTGTSRTIERSSGSSSSQRSYSTPSTSGTQRSNSTPNTQRSYTAPNTQRSYSTPNTPSQRSFSSPSPQRSGSSYQRSGGSSVQRSMGSSVQRSSSPGRSSGTSVNRGGIQRSGGGSSKSGGSRGRD
jgi:hypothetical protein